MKTKRPTLIALAGMPGAGKSTFVSAIGRKWNLPVWYAGQPLLDECRRRGCPPTYANRMKAGQALGLFDPKQPLKFIAHSYAAMRQAHPLPATVVFDSVRTLEELSFLRDREPEVILVAVLLGRGERHRRLHRRDGSSWRAIRDRDLAEVGAAEIYGRRFNVGPLIALADCYYVTPPDEAGATDPNLPDLKI